MMSSSFNLPKTLISIYLITDSYFQASNPTFKSVLVSLEIPKGVLLLPVSA